ncbi:neugrin [Brachyistius frenatus]|uniref:neugrin n=1 Tax=Brachyistius frenatus TaxID=100188 RepID=UPI0037E8327D
MSMARLLQVFSRLDALSGMTSVFTNSCRFASGGAGKAWMGQSHAHRHRGTNRHRDEPSDEEHELEDVEDKLDALVHEGRKRQRTVKYHIMRRQMTPSGAPERKLTWDAIEQIRYLKQEQPEEWTVEHLAEGFSVTHDVILKVLRSKFIPSPERKAKQNAKVMAGLGQQVLPSGAGTQQDRLKLLENHTQVTLPSGRKDGALVSVADQTPMIRGEGSGSVAKSPVSVTVLPTQFAAVISKDATMMRSTEDNGTTATIPTEEDEESWDGRVLTEEELEEFMKMEKPSPVVQVGNDFFDAEGNFVYRI